MSGIEGGCFLDRRVFALVLVHGQTVRGNSETTGRVLACEQVNLVAVVDIRNLESTGLSGK